MNVIVDKYCSVSHLTSYCLVKCHEVHVQLDDTLNNRSQAKPFSPRSGIIFFFILCHPNKNVVLNKLR